MIGPTPSALLIQRTDEVDRLEAEVARLTAEREKWRRVAQDAWAAYSRKPEGSAASSALVTADYLRQRGDSYRQRAHILFRDARFVRVQRRISAEMVREAEARAGAAETRAEELEKLLRRVYYLRHVTGKSNLWGALMREVYAVLPVETDDAALAAERKGAGDEQR